MTIILSNENLQEICSETINDIVSADGVTESETFLEIPQKLGNGYLRNIKLCEGILLTIADVCASDDIVVKMPVREHPVELIFRCSSSCKVKGEFDKSNWESKLLGSGIAPGNKVESKKMEHNQVINIHFEPQLLQNLFGESSGELPPELKLVIKKDDWRTCFQLHKLPSVVLVLIQEILHCPYQGLTKKMYLQGKVFELMALQLKTLQQENDVTNCEHKLKQEDIERIHYAKDVLLARWQNPPSLLELAREVGLNDYKLKIGFRYCFNQTVFGTLQDYRMEQARHLLAEGSLNVTGIARTVGYRNRSHFAAAFKRKYGVNPSTYLSRK